MTEAERVARWKCNVCGGELTMAAGFAEFGGYACCYTGMEFLGVVAKKPHRLLSRDEG